uniref:Uncharacterized protein n=1 Tax=Noccaea caerulescens TaxID=107243 RepID=A0A1J3FZ96_NOCCA
MPLLGLPPKHENPPLYSQPFRKKSSCGCSSLNRSKKRVKLQAIPIDGAIRPFVKTNLRRSSDCGQADCDPIIVKHQTGEARISWT